jgi:hypothetical protein
MHRPDLKLAIAIALSLCFLPACDLFPDAAQVVNETDQRLEIFRRNARTGDVGISISVISPGGDANLRLECEESLGTVVAVREEPLCRGDRWVVVQP